MAASGGDAKLFARVGAFKSFRLMIMTDFLLYRSFL